MDAFDRIASFAIMESLQNHLFIGTVEAISGFAPFQISGTSFCYCRTVQLHVRNGESSCTITSNNRKTGVKIVALLNRL